MSHRNHQDLFVLCVYKYKPGAWLLQCVCVAGVLHSIASSSVSRPANFYNNTTGKHAQDWWYHEYFVEMN